MRCSITPIRSISPMPDSQEMSGNLWFLFINGSAPGELERYISNRLKRRHLYSRPAEAITPTTR